MLRNRRGNVQTHREHPPVFDFNVFWNAFCIRSNPQWSDKLYGILREHVEVNKQVPAYLFALVKRLGYLLAPFRENGTLLPLDNDFLEAEPIMETHDGYLPAFNLDTFMKVFDMQCNPQFAAVLLKIIDDYAVRHAEGGEDYYPDYILPFCEKIDEALEKYRAKGVIRDDAEAA